MKVLVAVKRVLDHNVKARVKSDGSGIDLAGARMSINPFDEIAVEQAVRLKESGVADEVVVVSIGSDASQEVLRTALAIGADRAVLVQTDQEVEPLGVAKVLAVLAQREEVSLVLLGKQAIDDDCSQTGPMLAALLDWPQGIVAYGMSMGDGSLDVQCEIDGGVETVSLSLPAVVTADLRLNTPRHATLPNIIKAKKKPLESITPEVLGSDLSLRLRTLRVAEPPTRSAGKKLTDVAAFMAELKQRAEAH
jgi:electron transfer flavoprotein beta subunit